MQTALFIEQLLNGLQLGVMLFLMAAGLTLIFGVMGLINLAHGSLYMVGAFACAIVAAQTGSFWLGLVASLAAAAAAGAIIEILVIRRLYQRDHLSQVLAVGGVGRGGAAGEQRAGQQGDGSEDGESAHAGSTSACAAGYRRCLRSARACCRPRRRGRRPGRRPRSRAARGRRSRS